MKTILPLFIFCLLSACGNAYNHIDTREVLVSSVPSQPAFGLDDASIDVTEKRITYVR